MQNTATTSLNLIDSVFRKRNVTESVVTDSAHEVIVSPEDIPDEYDSNNEEPGLLVIFNHETFISHDNRLGTSLDREAVIDCFDRLQYKNHLIFNDLTKSEIQENLMRIAQMDHSNRNSLMVVFLTHGTSDGKLFTSDGNYIISEEVVKYFSATECPTLKGKPKIFMFQACKGSMYSTARRIETDYMRSEEARKKYTLPDEADILVAFSSTEGYVSFRHTEKGTWYIQELCKNITAYGRREDFVSILTRVSKCVAYHYQYDNYKQMPCFLSTLTRKFYLHKSKERGYLLDISENCKIVQNKIEALYNEIRLDDSVKNKTEHKRTNFTSSWTNNDKKRVQGNQNNKEKLLTQNEQTKSVTRKQLNALETPRNLIRKTNITSNSSLSDKISINKKELNVPDASCIKPEPNPYVKPRISMGDEYNIDKPGLIIIYNHYDIAERRTRKGTEKDVEELQKCFKKICTSQIIIRNNKKKREIEKELDEVACNPAYKDKGYLIVLFLTHGNDEGKIYTSCGRPISSEAIWETFCLEGSIWIGKPKAFIFQACKGPELSKVTKNISLDIGGMKHTYTLPVEADILLAYSTVQGFASLREHESGTWFIQELCKTIMKYGYEEDLVSMLTRVSKCVALNEVPGEELEERLELKHYIVKQMPCFISTLTQKFFLRKPSTKTIQNISIETENSTENTNYFSTQSDSVRAESKNRK